MCFDCYIPKLHLTMEIIFQCLWIEMANLNTGQKFLIPTQVDIEPLALRISVGCRFDRLLLSREYTNG